LPRPGNSRYLASTRRLARIPALSILQDSSDIMTDLASISFVKPGRKLAGTVVAFAGDDLKLGKMAAALGVGDLVRQAAGTAEFKGKPRSVLDLLAPRGTDLDRLIVVGVGKAGELTQSDWV
jgi:leucyl aminopeptidase